MLVGKSEQEVEYVIDDNEDFQNVKDEMNVQKQNKSRRGEL